ncbi:MAG: hypothetical protein IAE87_17765 [Rhodobacteraceae bacterium]|jgi:hypothetical protein|nr:hypothetical protein [Paracoccaceae bacterium]
MTAFPNRQAGSTGQTPTRLQRLLNQRVWPAALAFALIYLAALVLVLAPGMVPGLGH